MAPKKEHRQFKPGDRFEGPGTIDVEFLKFEQRRNGVPAAFRTKTPQEAAWHSDLKNLVQQIRTHQTQKKITPAQKNDILMKALKLTQGYQEMAINESETFRRRVRGEKVDSGHQQAANFLSTLKNELAEIPVVPKLTIVKRPKK